MNGRVVGIPERDILCVGVSVFRLEGRTVTIELGLLVIVREREEHDEDVNDLVNGLVVGIPENVLDIDVDLVLVTLTVRVKLPEELLVLSSEGLTVTKALGLLVNGKDVGIPDRVTVKEVDLVLVTLTVSVKLAVGDLVNGGVVGIGE